MKLQYYLFDLDQKLMDKWQAAGTSRQASIILSRLFPWVCIGIRAFRVSNQE